MPRDHFVAQTYLKHFVGNDGMLHAYRKSDGKYFPCRPRDICHEWDGDLIRDFLREENWLGSFRRTFEPKWNPALEELRNGHNSGPIKLAIAGYWANLLVCTPAWTRLGVKARNESAVNRLRAYDALKSRAGKPDTKLKQVLAAINAGQIGLATEPDAIRAMSAARLSQYAWALYNADWIVMRNDTGTDLLTSDNPVAFDDPGPWRGGQPGLPRYLTLTPTLCLYGFMDPRRSREEPDFALPPRGSIQWATIRPRDVERINRTVAQCAEDLIISSSPSHSVETLVRECARYRVDIDFIKLQFRPDKFISGMRTRVREVA